MTAPDAPQVASRPRPRSIGGWLLLFGACVALNGLIGGAAVVVVAAVVLAGVPTRVLGAMGVASLAAVPFAVLVQGLPSPDEVSPLFASASLWPHHLTFAGLVFAGAWVVLDVIPDLERSGDPPITPSNPSPLPVPVAIVVLAAVAVGSLAAVVAVLGA